MLQVSELYVYPVKSLPGIRLESALVTDRGFEHDRRWMLVDENNVFMSQRLTPEMTQLLPSIESNGIRVTNKNTGDYFLIPAGDAGRGGKNQVEVAIWDDTCMAAVTSEAANEWFSKNLGVKCKLVYMPEDSLRAVDQKYASGNYITSMSDGYPFLVIGQSSLDDLNQRLPEALPMNRFRPNIVFTGGKPFEEDLMDHFKIAGIDFHGVKLCARCPIPTIDQQTGHRSKEPLKTLAKYRLRDNNVYFGQNLVHDGSGTIKVGDIIEKITSHTEARFYIPPQEPLIAKIDKTLI